MNVTTQQESEYKFDVPVGMSEKELMRMVEAVLQKVGWKIMEKITEKRTFQYYDTPSLDAYKKGETIRKVGGFDLKKEKGLFRYDVKIGSCDDRYETSSWSNKALSPTAIVKLLTLAGAYEKLIAVAYATTKHRKLKVCKGDTHIEVTYDVFKVKGGLPFRELELELEQGDRHELKKLALTVGKRCCLKQLSKQKYSRVLEGIREGLLHRKYI